MIRECTWGRTGKKAIANAQHAVSPSGVLKVAENPVERRLSSGRGAVANPPLEPRRDLKTADLVLDIEPADGVSQTEVR